jgi:class 3 adenylate cyclase
VVRSRRLVTVVFTDVTDSTSLADTLDPEQSESRHVELLPDEY